MSFTFPATCTMILLATALLGAPAALARDLSGAVTLGYGRLSADDGNDLSILGIDGYYDADFGNGVTFAADLSLSRTEFDSSTATTTEVRLKPRYRLASGVIVGAYYERLNIATSDDDIAFASYGLSLGYDTGAGMAEIYVGQTDGDGTDTADEIGLSVLYTPSDRLSLGVALAMSHLDEGDISTVRLGGVYGISDKLSMFGGIETADVDGLGIDSVGLGVGYGLGDVLGRPATVSVELEHIALDGNDVNGLRIGLTIPLGGAGVKAPLNSAAHRALRPRHTALPSLLSQGVLF